jgi:hypothetical protein
MNSSHTSILGFGLKCHLWFIHRVTEDGDPYVRPEDENYENESVRQLENELKMEEYLKQKLQDEAYQVQELVPPSPPLSSALSSWVFHVTPKIGASFFLLSSLSRIF